MRIEYLANLPQYLPQIAQWYYDEWNDLMEGKTIQEEIEYLRTYLNNNEVPFILIALEGDQLLGAVQIKRHEMSIYPTKEFWLGGVYVDQQQRNRGIAAKLVNSAISSSKALGIQKLHLQTEDLTGGLYALLGWKGIEQVNYHNVDVLVMERDI